MNIKARKKYGAIFFFRRKDLIFEKKRIKKLIRIPRMTPSENDRKRGKLTMTKTKMALGNLNNNIFR
jgi:hypothetical protein